MQPSRSRVLASHTAGAKRSDASPASPPGPRLRTAGTALPSLPGEQTRSRLPESPADARLETTPKSPDTRSPSRRPTDPRCSRRRRLNIRYLQGGQPRRRGAGLGPGGGGARQISQARDSALSHPPARFMNGGEKARRLLPLPLPRARFPDGALGERPFGMEGGGFKQEAAKLSGCGTDWGRSPVLPCLPPPPGMPGGGTGALLMLPGWAAAPMRSLLGVSLGKMPGLGLCFLAQHD